MSAVWRTTEEHLVRALVKPNPGRFMYFDIRVTKTGCLPSALFVK